jgi:glutamine synthetase
MFAPVEPNWGANHRNVSLRIPISDAKNLRFEHRVSGADANPYLVAAAILSGVHYGITHQCNPGKMIQEFEVISLNQEIPNRWNKAIDEFEDSKILPNYLGEEFCKTFIANRRFEESEFNNNISDIDYSWYLRSV